MSSFYKNALCPPSQRLLAYQTGEVEPVEERAIIAHLDLCEFCSAEVALYSCFPPEEEMVSPPRIPDALFQLASALLGPKRSPSASNLLNEIDALYDDGFPS